MKLMYQDSTLDFEVSSDKVTVISFENCKVFRRMVTELDIQCYNAMEGKAPGF